MELPSGIVLPAIAQLVTSQANYQRHARLQLRVDSLSDGEVVWCSAWQTNPAVNGQVFTEAEILDRALEGFAPLHDAGYYPVISVLTLDKGTPEKPVTKHPWHGMPW